MSEPTFETIKEAIKVTTSAKSFRDDLQDLMDTMNEETKKDSEYSWQITKEMGIIQKFAGCVKENNREFFA